jgi:HTH-type transcriptional regulator/antitoxin HigA
MATDINVSSDLPIPPGELLTETLEALSLSQAELARRMERPVQAINEIARGTKEITPETAIQLERVLGVPAHIWLGLETEYQHTKARLEDRRRLEEEATLAEKFPCEALARLGWIPKTRDRVTRVECLLAFFGVGSLRVVREAEAAAYRVSRTRDARPEALAAWLRKGAIDAQNVPAKPFSEQRLRALLPRFRNLTTEMPSVFEPAVKEDLASCGVALILLPHLPKTHAHGAARWLSPEKALLLLSLRGKWADIFWFSLFHEIGHLLLHGRRDVFIEWDERDEDSREREADAFAADVLIPPQEFQSFVKAHRRVSGRDVAAFARSQNISPGVVVGRLQYERVIRYSDLNGLRMKLEWANPAAG